MTRHVVIDQRPSGPVAITRPGCPWCQSERYGQMNDATDRFLCWMCGCVWHTEAGPASDLTYAKELTSVLQVMAPIRAAVRAGMTSAHIGERAYERVALVIEAELRAAGVDLDARERSKSD